MSVTLDFTANYVLNAIVKEIVPQQTFFKDRYFPTGAGDIFAADKVLTEYKKGGRKMAAFVAPRVGDIPVGREGYAVHEYQPAYIAPSRLLTLDDLDKRGFGEALYPGSTQAERAARIIADDLKELDELITRREEWMAAQVLVNNACTMQTYLDATTQGEVEQVVFYDGTSDHTYTVAASKKWGTANADVYGDVRKMCQKLASRGLPATDLVLGQDAADALLGDAKMRELLDRNLAIEVGTVDATVTYPGVAYLGTLNFGGFRLKVFAVSETYADDSGATQDYFPAKGALVTAPGCGHMMYGQITQIDYGATVYTTYAQTRVQKLVIDQANDVRKLRLGARPLAAPKTYCPFIYAANVC